jgi:hypothetical protein
VKAGDHGEQKFRPHGWPSRMHAIYDIVRFGPGLFPSPVFLVFLYLAERTLLFGKHTDVTAVSQVEHGIFERGIRRWHRFSAGLSRSSFWRAVEILEELELVCKFKRHSPGRHNDEASAYQINWRTFHGLVERAKSSGVGEKGQPLDDTRKRVKDLGARFRAKSGEAIIEAKAQMDAPKASQEARAVATVLRHHGIIGRRALPKEAIRAILVCAREYNLMLTSRDIADVLKMCNVLGPKTHKTIGVQQVSNIVGELKFKLTVATGMGGRRYAASPSMVTKASVHQKLAASQAPRRDLPTIQ